MSATSTTTMPPKPAKRHPVPLLLESFPAPPSHIPPTPTTPLNPPPTGPPTTPLPPVPGPSRISEHEQLLLLTSAANRSRRSSKYSTSSQRQSLASLSSDGHPRSPQAPISPLPLSSRRDSSASSSAPTSPRLSAFPRPHISVSAASSRQDKDNHHHLTPIPLSDIEHDESINEIDIRDVLGLSPPSSPKYTTHHHHLSQSDHIDPPLHTPTHSPSSSTSMLHNSTSSIGSFSYPSSSKRSPVTVLAPFVPAPSSSHPPLPPPPAPSPYQYTQLSQELNPSVSTTTQLSDLEPRPFSPSNTMKDSRLERRAERTRSEGLRKALGNRSRSRSNADRKPEPDLALPALPVGLGIQVKKEELSGIVVTKVVNVEVSKVHDLSIDDLRINTVPPRSPSPDIDSILNTSTSKKSRTRRRVVSAGSSSSLRSTESWDPKGMLARVKSVDFEHESILEGDASDGSDSSLDLHTPLPHLMVRHGLLSPNSKLLPGVSRATTPMVGVDGRPGSTMSVNSNASMMTKSGVIKDDRNTPMRRVRHRDGKMLRGGIGLTTGLGWSDSEDEDAPSPLTRRLSSLNLSRRSSASSIVPGGPPSRSSSQYRHPLSRSYSSGALLQSERGASFNEYDEFDDEFEEDDNALKESGEWAQRQRDGQRKRVPSSGFATPKPSLPPTSWQRRAVSGPGDRSSGGTDRLSRTSLSSAGRYSTGSSVDSHLPRTSNLKPAKKPSMDDGTSTSSTVSIPMPATPRDLEQTPLAKKISNAYDKDKSLPPLPAGGLKKTPSGPSKVAFPRARTFSAAASTTVSTPTPPSPGVRPLQLPRLAAAAGVAAGRDRAAVPVPSILASSASRTSLRTPSSSYAFSPSPTTTEFGVLAPSSSPSSSSSPPPPPTLSTSTSGIGKPRPRTGTGMVYRTSSSVGLASKMRAPVSLSASMGAAAAAASSGGSIGRNAIAL